ncbi:MAG TPA: hypothetical protein VM580_19420 [Labilithrix sp.]|jgi:hypothetical protein|nr:hypothetical protein [Labilithrix sp.]
MRRRPRFLHQPNILNLAAAGLCGALALVEVIRLIASGGTSTNYTVLWTLVSGVTFAVVLAGAAIGFVLHRQFGWALGVFGLVLGAAHGIAVRSAGQEIGVLYMLASPILFILLVKTLHEYSTGRVPSASPA